MTSKSLPRLALALASLLAFTGCPNPNNTLSIDKFSLVFTRAATTDSLEVKGRTQFIAGEEVRKRITISNSKSDDVLLHIFLADGEDSPDPSAFRFEELTPPLSSLDPPFNYEVKGFSELELNIGFVGTKVGANLARLIIENVDDGFRQEIILQGTVDCVSLGWDLDRDGFCTNVADLDPGETGGLLLEDCDDNPDNGHLSFPGNAEVCEDGAQIDNDCDGETLVLVDEDEDGVCDLAASCGEPAELVAACGHEDGDCNDDNPLISPNVLELCEPLAAGSQIDNDCDPTNDTEAMTSYLVDGDRDGWGSSAELILVCGAPPAGFAVCQPDGNDGCIEDCDDQRDNIFPGAPEICDGFDNDCDGNQAAGDVDDDGDGFPLCALDTAGDPIDCDDGNPFVYLGAPELCDANDNDCDGIVPLAELDDDGDGFVECTLEPNVINFPNLTTVSAGGDCDDGNLAVNPGASEVDAQGQVVCDFVDNDCSGQVHADEFDDDSDGASECGGDCNDGLPTVGAGAPELCDGLDNDCDAEAIATANGGVVGDLDGDGIPNWLDTDLDGDGLGNVFDPDLDGDGIDNGLDDDANGDGIPDIEEDDDGDGWVECVEDDLPWPQGSIVGYTGVVGQSGGGDCNDDPFDPVSAAVYPGAPEISDSYWDYTSNPSVPAFREVDNQCVGDPGFGQLCEDFTVSSTADCLDPLSACMSCTGSELDEDEDGYTEAQGDCDDGNANRTPGAVEVCDGEDNDCSGSAPVAELDLDGDGYVACEPGPTITSVLGGDCDDASPLVNPGALEQTNGIDDNCDGVLGPAEIDNDGDGVSPLAGDCDDDNPATFPGAAEICDGLDNDCAGGADFLDPILGNELDEDGDGYTACGDADCLDSAFELDNDWLAEFGALYPGSNGTAVANAIHPGAVEICDGWANDCLATASALPYLPNDTQAAWLTEFDHDDDGWVDCTDPGVAAWDAGTVSSNEDLVGANDCADIASHTNGIAAPLFDINPGHGEQCDGWDNNCGDNTPFVDALSDEFDDDGDRYIECSNFLDRDAENAAGQELLEGGDCLDEEQNHEQTGQLLTLGIAAQVRPNAAEVCDGFNTDCSLPLEAVPYDPEQTDENDADLDTFVECTTAAAWMVPGLDTGDCLDEAQAHFESGQLITLVVANLVNPAASESCDGFNSDCSLPLMPVPYDAQANDEDDQDGDLFLECDGASASLAPGFATDDCLDEITVHFATGQIMGLNVAAEVHPGAVDACDGLNTDCSGPLQAVIYDTDEIAENDADSDGFLECGSPASWIGDVGFQTGDCLDEVTSHFETGSSMPLTVAAQVFPGAPEVCDGLNSDCSLPLQSVPYDAEQTTENDTDQDGYLECPGGAPWIADVGFATGDCLDEETIHFETGQSMGAAVGAEVHPGAAEVCDGLNTNCSLPLQANSYDAEQGDEDDVDTDGYVECTLAAAWLGDVGFQTGDCLDESFNHPITGQNVPLATAAAVNPGASASDACDALNTDCSLPLAVPSWAPDETDEQDVDFDLYLACTGTPATLVGGYDVDDCNDGDASINPGEFDDFGANLVDNDCDGTMDEDGLSVGSVTVSEVLADPGNNQTEEWFEIRNNESSVVRIEGWTFSDEDSDSFVVVDTLDIPPADYAVLCRNPGAVPAGVTCSNSTPFEGLMALALGSDELVITAPNTPSGDLELDVATWSSAFGANKISVGVDPAFNASPLNLHVANNSANNWCQATAPWPNTNGVKATPGGENPSCAVNEQDNDLDGYCEFGVDINGDGDCNDDDEPLSDPQFPGSFGLTTCTGTLCDCLDDNADVNPDAAEVCDGWDTDCSQDSVNAPPEDGDEVDGDGDTFIECPSFVDHNHPVVTGGDDCDDSSDTTFTGATEQCDTVDHDCDTDPFNGFANFDGDATPDCFDTDDDNDTVLDGPDSNPFNQFVCADSDGDSCDDCSVLGAPDITNDGTDTDGDGDCNAGDTDDDNDTVLDGADSAPLDNFLCTDADSDTCDDCSQTGGPPSTSNDGLDTDSDGACNAGDADDDNDTVADGSDTAPLNNFLCSDTDSDDCDDCSVTGGPPATNNDGVDTNGDGICDAGSTDDDGDGVSDGSDLNPTDPNICQDVDGDGCDDCSVTGGPPNTANDGLDTDSDGLCNVGDTDDDGDTVADASDDDPLNAFDCRDVDGDTCDDCSVIGSPNTANDGVDTDSDGACNAGDTDDDNDTVLDGPDSAPLNAFACQDTDSDGCDDCSQTGGPPSTANDGLDTDSDGECNVGDSDDDGDTVVDTSDNAPLNAFSCQDLDSDLCDDCSVVGSPDISDDGSDNDSDGLCDLGDTDDDNDSVPDSTDTSPFNSAICSDTDGDTCDDCSVTNGPPAVGNDGTDSDGDGDCDAGDTDDDNDGRADGSDSAPLNPALCADTDGDTCDDCSVTTFDPSNDGLDTDSDGTCNDGDTDDDNDGRPDGSDTAPLNSAVCADTDGDTCDDCSVTTFNPANDGDDFEGDGLCDAGDPDDDNDGEADGPDCDQFDAGRYHGNTEIVDDGIDQDCNDFDSISCWGDADLDGFGVGPARIDVTATCTGVETTTLGDCNDGHAGVNPSATLPRSPGSGLTSPACDDTDDDGYCLGGGVDVNDDGDCEDDGEDYGAAATVAGDCDEVVLYSADAESGADGVDDDTDGTVDEGCYGGGELIVVEIYSDDSESEPDWIEVFNATWFDVDIQGWVVAADASATVPTGSAKVIGVGSRDVLAAGALSNVSPLVTSWTSTVLTVDDLDGAQDDTLSLTCAAVTVDSIDLTAALPADWQVSTAKSSLAFTEPSLAGALTGVTDPAVATSTNWCEAPSDTWAANPSYVGSPQDPNGTCP